MQKLLNQKIHQLYSLQHEINYHDKALFDTPIEDRLKLPLKQKENWIMQTSKTMQKCMSDHQQKMTEGQQDIRQFFTNKGTEQ